MHYTDPAVPNCNPRRRHPAHYSRRVCRPGRRQMGLAAAGSRPSALVADLLAQADTLQSGKASPTASDQQPQTAVLPSSANSSPSQASSPIQATTSSMAIGPISALSHGGQSRPGRRRALASFCTFGDRAAPRPTQGERPPRNGRSPCDVRPHGGRADAVKSVEFQMDSRFVVLCHRFPLSVAVASEINLLPQEPRILRGYN